MYTWVAVIWMLLIYLFALGMIFIVARPSPRFGGLFYTVLVGLLCSAAGLYGYPSEAVVTFPALLVLYPAAMMAVILFKTAFPPDRDLELEREQQMIEFWAFVILAVGVGGMYILPPAFEYIRKLWPQIKEFAEDCKNLFVAFLIVAVVVLALFYFLYVLWCEVPPTLRKLWDKFKYKR